MEGAAARYMSQTISATTPVVTFALLTFNQESYVEDAIRGAFGQDYPLLEIIISDDCSTDSTFDRVNEIARSYKGPHEIKVRKSSSNKGTLLHVLEVAAIAKGSLLLLAAGDDVSKPDRTSRLVEHWLNTGAWALCSRYDVVNASGQLLESSVKAEVLSAATFTKYFYLEEGPISVVHGCTSAYDIRAFAGLRADQNGMILAEDGALSVWLNLQGKKIVHLEDSLVLYRQNESSLTNGLAAKRREFRSIVTDESRIEWFNRAQANRCKLFLQMEGLLGSLCIRRLRTEAVQQDLERLVVRGTWSQRSIVDRARHLAKFHSVGDLQWGLPRLLSIRLFLVAKWIYSFVR